MPDLDLGHMVAEGFLEAPADRYMLDFGAYAQIVADGKVFGGLPGRPLDSLRTDERRGPDDLLSVLEKLAVGADAQSGSTANTFAASGPPIARHRKAGREQVTLAVTKEQTTDLWDFGVSLQDLDWARLPGRAPA
jgi:hypothetical protein